MANCARKCNNFAVKFANCEKVAVQPDRCAKGNVVPKAHALTVHVLMVHVVKVNCGMHRVGKVHRVKGTGPEAKANVALMLLVGKGNDVPTGHLAKVSVVQMRHLVLKNDVVKGLHAKKNVLMPSRSAAKGNKIRRSSPI